MNVFSKKSRLFTQADLRLSTLVRESTAITHTLSEHEFLFFGSEHPTVLIIDHIFFLFFLYFQKQIFFLFSKNQIQITKFIDFN